jgi:hypothetical protein
MKHSSGVIYEVIVPETNEMFVTLSRESALDYYYRDYMVFERQISQTTPSVNTQTRVVVTMRWNNNPDFNPNTWEEVY